MTKKVFLFTIEDVQAILSQHAVAFLGLEPGTYNFTLAMWTPEGELKGFRLVATHLDKVRSLVKTLPLEKCGMREPEPPTPAANDSKPQDP